MSGGSMEYLSYKVEDANFEDSSILRRAFRKHLKDVAAALHAIEWNDSGDGHDSEDELIVKCLYESHILETAVEEARKVKHDIETLLQRLESK